MEQKERLIRKVQILREIGQEMQRLGRLMMIKSIDNQENSLDEFFEKMLQYAKTAVELKKPAGETNGQQKQQ